MKILLTTMGTSWPVVPELFGFTNPEEYPFYANHPAVADFERWREEFGIVPVDEIWVVTTNGERVMPQREKLERWAQLLGVSVRQFSSPDLQELATVEECRLMADLIYRLTLRAQSFCEKVFLSLAGGRKTMSADVQQAGNIFGCHALLHVVDSGSLPPVLRDPAPEALLQSLSLAEIASISPLVVSGAIFRSPVLLTDGGVHSNDFPVGSLTEKHEPLLYTEIRRRLKDAEALLFNYRRQLIGTEQTNFRALYALEPEILQRLQEERLGVDPSRRDAELAWLQKLPKAELHCHLGGILNPAEILEVAAAMPEKFAALLGHTAQKLEAKIYAGLFGDDAFCGVGIEKYLSLGELQGSALLQYEPCLRAACRILIRQCQENNVIYCELRCSPCNYTREGLTGEQVVNIIIDELSRAPKTFFRLIFIATRHKHPDNIRRHIQLAQNLLDSSSLFAKFFAGFDLAGDESAKTPEELREAFLPLMERCLNLTIHAGEGECAENIWQAVYHLNADRIGHGLTLKENEELLTRVVNKKIAIEMCPSSNFQIVGFCDFQLPSTSKLPHYPLSEYLHRGMTITINTDDPGISRTDLTNEYHKAARMTPGGLSKWEILQIIRNGFRAAFTPFETRRQLLLKAEKEVLENL